MGSRVLCLIGIDKRRVFGICPLFLAGGPQRRHKPLVKQVFYPVGVSLHCHRGSLPVYKHRGLVPRIQPSGRHGCRVLFQKPGNRLGEVMVYPLFPVFFDAARIRLPTPVGKERRIPCKIEFYPRGQAEPLPEHTDRPEAYICWSRAELTI